MKRHPLDRNATSLEALRQALSRQLGYPVDILTSHPVDGPGELIVEDPDTGEHLDVDSTLVADAVAEVAAVPVRAPLDVRTVELIRAASTVDQLRDALLAHFGERVEQQARAREAARRVREDLARRESDREGRA